MIWNMTTPSDRTWLSAPEVVSYGDEFELDQGDRLAVVRKNWSLNGDWSFGVASHVRSSTFDNIELDVRAAPALEWNYFPYSMYTRRQFRVLDEIGVSSRSYCEETLFGEFEETRAHEQLSATYEQREPWGTLEGRVEASNYFPGLSEHRFEVDGEVNVRIARGLSLNVEASASRIRDQLSLPRRDASAEEVLLRLRQLQSGFQTRVELGIEYVELGIEYTVVVAAAAAKARSAASSSFTALWGVAPCVATTRIASETMIFMPVAIS
jgi:hypothetical protein